MDLKLKGKVALVTGASRGLGRAISEELGKEGANVIVNYLQDKKSAIEVAEIIEKYGGKALLFQANVESAEEVKKMVSAGVEKFGNINILVNNAGINLGGELRDNTLTEDKWQRVLNNHLNGTYYCTKEVLPQMIKNNYGKIINIASFAAMGAETGNEAYCTAKAGIIGFTKSLAKSVAKHNINVLSVSPGTFMTDMNTKDWLNTEEKLEGFRKGMPMQRLAYPIEVGNLVVFLASDKARHLTGVNINISGGEYV